MHGHHQNNPRVRKSRPPLRSRAHSRDGQVQRRAPEGWHRARHGWPPSQLQRRTRQIQRGGSLTVIDGPFTEAKELIAGFWIWQVRNIEEAVEWLKRCPCEPGAEVEIRQIAEMEDFAPVLSEEQIQHKIAKRAELPHQTVNK
ncbi:MAG TPA: YciI family protein [Acidobacteriaceae bacterium]